MAWLICQWLGLTLLSTTASYAAASPSDRSTLDSRSPGASPATPGAQEQKPLTFGVPPHARFIAPDAAIISWETDQPAISSIEYSLGENWDQKVQDEGKRTVHRLTVGGLEPKGRYQYRIRSTTSANDDRVSDAFELDNAMNYSVAQVPGTVSPYGSDADDRSYRQAAEQILSLTGVTKGYCLMLDCHEGQLAYELARRSELIVVGVDKDRDRTQRARTLLRKAGVYGSRITLHQADSLDRLPLPRGFANLIVMSEPAIRGALPASAAQVLSWLQPATGVACLGPFTSATPEERNRKIDQWLGPTKARWDLQASNAVFWLRARSDLPADTGSWTHQYGDASNAANSQEGLLGVTATDGLDVQWFGRPGADFGLDRNPRMPAPLAVKGRLYHQGLNRLIALDSYNGAVWWSLEIPDLRRVNMPRDCGNWCADPDHLFVAVKNQCWLFAAETGELMRTLPLADPGWPSSHEWGYVARAGDLLFGSSVKRGAVYTNFWGHESWYDATTGSGTEKVCSDDIFARDSRRGEVKWRYHNGPIINSTIAVANERVLFVECRDAEITTLSTSRIGSPRLWNDQHLMALDARTGTVLWDRPIDTVDGIVVFYLLAAENKMFILASAKGKYHLYAYRDADGQELWQATHDWTKDNHGGHLQHPVIVGGTLFLEPCGYSLTTGNLLTKNVGRHGGCATYAATLGALIYRGEGGRISMWDIEKGSTTSWHNLRPSCWLSTVPANGMVLSPEGGGGCSCGNWLETSIGFAPKPRPPTQ